MPLRSDTQAQLTTLLCKAYSGEMAAAYAYRGHWKSLKKGTEKDKIVAIEKEEWHHRRLVLQMLQSFGVKPRLWREIVFWSIGRILGPLCFVSGWFFPMFFAGRLETANVREYALAADLAKALNLDAMHAQLQKMAHVELDHEIFFYDAIKNHWLMPAMKILFR